MLSNYIKSLMCLAYSVIRTDGVIHNDESILLSKLHKYEKITPDIQNGFVHEIENLTQDQIYKMGLEALKKCTAEEQGKILGWIYNLAEIDKTVDIREARFLLYAINASDFNLEQVIEVSKSLPNLT